MDSGELGDQFVLDIPFPFSETASGWHTAASSCRCRRHIAEMQRGERLPLLSQVALSTFSTLLFA